MFRRPNKLDWSLNIKAFTEANNITRQPTHDDIFSIYCSTQLDIDVLYQDVVGDYVPNDLVFNLKKYYAGK